MAVKNDTLAKILKQTRKHAGLTQTRLSELAGVGKTLVFDLENGRDTVSFSNLKKICRVLNIKIQFMPPLKLEDE